MAADYVVKLTGQDNLSETIQKKVVKLISYYGSIYRSSFYIM